MLFIELSVHKRKTVNNVVSNVEIFTINDMISLAMFQTFGPHCMCSIVVLFCL